MVSLNAGEDIHFRKVSIDSGKCINCFECLKSCPAKALYNENNIIKINYESCYGCGRCEKSCLHNAINFIKLNNSFDNLNGISALEIHTGNNSIEEVRNYLESIDNCLKNIELLSFSVESQRFNAKELSDYVNSLTELISDKVIIQIDGAPMGATSDALSSLQSICAASILVESKTNAYIQISGGVNYFSKKLTNQLGLKISGFGYGTFARKIVLSYLEELDDLQFAAQMKRIVNITTNLVEV